MKLISYLLISILLMSIAFAVTVNTNSFTGQANPFNITFIGNQNQSFILPIPQYSYIRNVSLNLEPFLNNIFNSTNIGVNCTGTGITCESNYILFGSGTSIAYINFSNDDLNNQSQNITFTTITSTCGGCLPHELYIPVQCRQSKIELLFNQTLVSCGGDVSPTNVSCYNGTAWNKFEDLRCTGNLVLSSPRLNYYYYPRNISVYLSSNLIYNYSNLLNISQNASLNISPINYFLASSQQINLTFHSDTAGIIQVNLTNATSEFWLDNCTLGKNYSINYSIKDETTSSLISTATTTGTYNYTIDGINYYTYTLNAPLQSNFSICIFPNWTHITSGTTLYSSAGSDYPQRRFYSTDILTSIIQSKTLTLLNSSLGIYIRFKTTDSYNNVIAGVNIKAYRTSDLFTVIEEENTDDSGMATFFLNPNQDYYFIITKSGYSTFTSTLRPTTSEIIGIILTSSSAASAISYSSGINYYYSPANYQLEPNTFYNFTFNLSSSYWDITGCTFYLGLLNTTILTSSSSSFDARKCGINITYNTSDYESIVGYSIYELNHTINITETASQWNVNQYTYSNYTFMTIISDINNLVNSRIGGMSSSTLKLIVFFIIFGLVAYASYKFQGTALTSPEAITIFIVVLVWFFSFLGWITVELYGLNFVDSGSNHTVTWLKQYIIAILITVLGSAFVYRRYKYG